MAKEIVHRKKGGSENNEKAPDLKRGAYRWKGDDCAPSEWGNAVDRASKRAGKLGRGNEHSFRQGAPSGQIPEALLAGLISDRAGGEQGIGGRLAAQDQLLVSGAPKGE